MKVYQFINNGKTVAEVYENFEGRESLEKTDYSKRRIMDFNIETIKEKGIIGIQEFQNIKVINKDYYEEFEILPTIIKKLEKLNNISRKRWLGRFPSHFPDEIWNGHWQREESLLKKNLEELQEKYPITFRKAIDECNCKKYFISRNIHNDRVGLDTQDTPQGGGTIAQTDSFEETVKVALKVYGINNYFIH